MKQDGAPAMFSAGSSRRKKAAPSNFKENMHKHKNIILIAVAAVVIIALALVLFSGGGNDNPLLGKWAREESNGTTTLEFLPDGKLSIYVQAKGVEALTVATASYSMDGNKITIALNDVEQTGTYEINKNKLTIIQTGTKKTQVYVRQ